MTRHYTVITAAYWAFTITDGALRMLVLLHLHTLGHTPIEIASLFLLYEAFGVVTNFLGGFIGSRFGLKSTLVGGLTLQIGALGLLLVDPARLSIPLVMTAQALSGVAKDLTKMSAKSYVKLIVPAGDLGGLMKWVAVLTGSKNALKGVGFFVGGALLGAFGFRGACLGLAALIAAALIGSTVLLPRAPGRSKDRVGLSSIFSRDPRLNWLAVARLFLFAARDAWFVLALPLYMSSALGWSFEGIGAFLAAWVIGYGIVQASAPTLLRQRGRPAPDASRLGVYTLSLFALLGATAVSIQLGSSTTTSLTLYLSAFGIVFAGTSALHSYLVVAYAESDKVALRVGFYYTANALGRLFGTLISGVVYQYSATSAQGLRNALASSAVLALVSAAACRPLRRAELAEAT